jgi:hypothetical protein
VSKRIKILQGQSIYDVVIMHYGSLEGLGDFLTRNKLSLDITLTVNDTYLVGDAESLPVVNFFESKNIKPASGETQSPIPAPPQPPQAIVQVLNYFYIESGSTILEMTAKPKMAGQFPTITSNLTNLEIEINGVTVTEPILETGDEIKITYDAPSQDEELIWEGFV